MGRFVKLYPLQIVPVHQATLVPTKVDRVKRTFTGGVYNSAGELVHASRRMNRGPDEIEPFPQLSPETIDSSLIQDAELVQGKYLYLGYYTEHYGHFLIESLGRLWATCSLNKYDGYVFSDFVLIRKNENDITGLAKLCFSAFNIKDKDIVVSNKTQRYQRLDVPNSMIYIGSVVHPDMRYIFNHISSVLRSSETHQQPEKLYLSRSKLDKRKRKVVNEHNIEKAFLEFGYKVVHLQEIPFPEQLALLHNARVIAGLDGSALHNSVYMQPGAAIVNICGPRSLSVINVNQRMCDELNDIVEYNIEFSGEIINENKIISRFNIPHLKKWLRKNRVL